MVGPRTSTCGGCRGPTTASSIHPQPLPAAQRKGRRGRICLKARCSCSSPRRGLRCRSQGLRPAKVTRTTPHRGRGPTGMGSLSSVLGHVPRRHFPPSSGFASVPPTVSALGRKGELFRRQAFRVAIVFDSIITDRHPAGSAAGTATQRVGTYWCLPFPHSRAVQQRLHRRCTVLLGLRRQGAVKEYRSGRPRARLPGTLSGRVRAVLSQKALGNVGRSQCKPLCSDSCPPVSGLLCTPGFRLHGCSPTKLLELPLTPIHPFRRGNG